MSAVVINGDTSGSITLQAPAVAGTNTLTLPANTGTVITTASTFSGTGPAFSAYATSNQAISSATNTKVVFDTEDFDTNSNFSSNRFTPTVAGYYQINANLNFANTGGTYGIVMLWKNGAIYKTMAYGSTSSSFFLNISGSTIVSMNGTTDYLEIYTYVGSSLSLIANAGQGNNAVNFSGSLVRAA